MGIKKIKLPDLGEGVTEGEIIKIKVSQGEKISMDQPLLEVMTDKASMEVPSSIEGLIQKVSAKEGDIVPVGADLFTVQTEGEEEETAPLSKNPPKQENLKTKQAPSISSFSETKILAIPSTKKLAEELNIPLTNIPNSKGEIKREDLLNYIRSRLSSSTSRAKEQKTDLPAPDEVEKREPVRGVKRLMFESMTLSKATIPHFTVGERARADLLITLKKEFSSRLQKQNLKTGFLPFFIKALLPTLKEYPIFNSFYSAQSKEIVFRKNPNIGFAVDSPQGLMVPVLKQAQNKSFLAIIKEVQKLAESARKGTIPREHLTGATISITNLGSLGGIYGTPIIPPSEMAILGVYRIFPQTVRNALGNFEERSFINFSLTCDHRFIDGATAVRFLKSFVQRIEDPSLLLLD